MKKIIGFILIAQSNFIMAQSYTHKSWCKRVMSMKVAPYIEQSSDFVDLDPRILAVGMASEGFSIKDRRSGPKKNNIYNGVEEIFYQDKYGNLKEKYGSKVQDAVTEHVVDKYSYGETWNDDGADTFGMEFYRLNKLGLIPKDVTYTTIDKYHEYKLGNGPDFVFSEKERLNETATQRFLTSSLYENNGETRDYTKRIGRQSKANIKGDWGHTFFKTPKAQVIANAAMWKHASLKLETMRQNLLDKAKEDLKTDYLKEQAQKNIDQLSRPMSKYEEVFWTKVVYNAGQGSQAAAYDMMRNYLKNNYLKDENYLTTRPSKSYAVVYDNGRHMLDSYKYAETQNCPSPTTISGKTKLDTKTIKFSDEYSSKQTSQSTSTNE